MMILITGGAGYIGSHVNKYLHQRGYRTVVVDNLIYGHREFVKWGDFIFCDLSDPDHLSKCLKDYPITAVMHFSGFAYIGESVTAPSKYYQNNLLNTINILDYARNRGINWFIFSSSSSIYGIPNRIPILEDHPLNPINPYGRTKMMVEQILKDYEDAYGIKHVSLRYFNAAGADPDSEIGERHDPETHLIPLVLDTAVGKREDIKIYGADYDTPDGTCVRDYVHVTDLAQAHFLALEYLISGGKSDAFNLGNGTGYSVYEVVDMARRITGKKIKVVSAARRRGDPSMLVSSSEKAKAILHWKPHFCRMEDIIETAWTWHREGI